MALWKLQCFFTKVMGLYRFFDGSGPNFFCRVNGLVYTPRVYATDEILLEKPKPYLINT